MWGAAGRPHLEAGEAALVGGHKLRVRQQLLRQGLLPLRPRHPPCAPPPRISQTQPHNLHFTAFFLHFFHQLVSRDRPPLTLSSTRAEIRAALTFTARGNTGSQLTRTFYTPSRMAPAPYVAHVLDVDHP